MNKTTRKEGTSLRAEVAAIIAGTQGRLYDANYDSRVLRALDECKDLCWEINNLRPSDREGCAALVRKLFASTKSYVNVVPPFWCDYGKNISVGENFFCNHNTVILDGAPVTFGDIVFIAPNCVFSTAGHPIDATRRNEGLEYALPITVGDDVWFGMGVLVCPGVTIGSNVVIGAGSVVTKDIPSGVVAVGNPCKPLRPIGPQDAERYVRYERDNVTAP